MDINTDLDTDTNSDMDTDTPCGYKLRRYVDMDTDVNGNGLIWRLIETH